MQARIGIESLGSDLAAPDPPAHFTTGVLLYDYVRNWPPSPPLPFAECFYVQYPKVALGHWPPVFYVFECLWFLIFGPSIVAARCLGAAVAASAAAVLWRQCRAHWNHEVSGPLAAAIFLSFPIVRALTWWVMSDILLSLFVFLAVSRFGAWLAGGVSRHIWWCALWTTLAILTKGTGWLLPFVFLAGPAISGRASAYRSRSYWIAIALSAVVSVPFFLAMDMLHLGYPAEFARQMRGALSAAASLGGLARLAFAALLLGGVLFCVMRFPPRRPRHVMCLSMGLWIAAQAAMLVVFPNFTLERARFLVPCIAPAIFIASGALSALESCAKRWGWPKGVLTVVAGYAALAIFGVPTANSVRGYAAAIDAIPLRAVGPVIWVQSNASGEGALIARRLETDRARSTYIVRGAKMLADSTWSGYAYSLRYRKTEDVLALLDWIPVDYIIFDTGAARTPDADLMRAALASVDSNFSLLRTQSIQNHGSAGELLIYQRRSRPRPGPVALSVMLGPERNHREISCQQRAW
jgi:4-amino-4-deoxy-L-arabinose transferase-like glycosyltransferase